MNGRLTPEQLAACDELLTAAGEGLDILTEGFPPLLESHEFTAACMAVFNTLDSQFAPVQLQYMLAVAIARLAGIWGATAIGDPIQDAHGVLWDSTIAAQRTDADVVLDQLADKNDETASEGEVA